MRHAASPPTATFGWFFRFWALHRRQVVIGFAGGTPRGASRCYQKLRKTTYLK